MSFYTYMQRNHKGEGTPAGDLAADMFRDRDGFPINGNSKTETWHKVILDYLKSNHACWECLATFEECWSEYATSSA